MRGKFFREGAELQLPVSSERSSQAEFAQGQIVCLASDPAIRGAVVEVLPGTTEDRIKVFVDGSIQTYYASQLQADDQDDGVSSLSSAQFHAYLTALQIRYPGLSTLYSLNAARVDFIPYQLRPVLKFIHSDRPRLLIAEARVVVEDYRRMYNQQRPHSSLGYKTPDEFAQALNYQPAETRLTHS